jgi:hypothetical protein
MTYLRKLILALALSAGLAPAFAQVPPPVPALPDTERRTSYSISASTCACNVGFALYGDSTDYSNWIEVFVNGVRMAQAGNWTLSSVTGTIGSIPLPITNAVLTFTAPQTGTIQIVGARRPRRTSQFNEGAGVPTRNFNVVLSDLTAQNRELWDKTNDVTGRALLSQPGVTLGLLPLPSACASGFLGFDATGLIPQCLAGGAGSGNVTGPLSTTVGHLALWNNIIGSQLQDFGGTSGGIPYFIAGGGIGTSSALAAGQVVIGGGAGVAPSTTSFAANQIVVGAPSGGGLTTAGTGTTTTVLHGGSPPSFGAVAIGSDVSGLGTGVATALGVNVGTAGAPVLFNGALGTPTSGTGTNLTGVPIGTGISGLGTGVATAAAINTGSSGALGVLIARGSTALGTGAISSATCATVVTATATGTATTDVVTASFNGDPTAVTGYIPSTAGMLTIFVYPTTNTFNAKVCNNTSASVTPGAITLNWRVAR